MHDEDAGPSEDPDDAEFADVEAFLSEHQMHVSPADQHTFTEEEAAEALAVSRSERRKEIAKLRQSRQFGSLNKDKRSYRVEIEELKKRTRCKKCNKVGHWARECRSTTSGPGDRGAAASTSSGPATGAGYVQADDEMEPTFVGAAEAWSEVCAAGLVSSPGFGVVDSGCGKTLIGANTLKQLENLIRKEGFGPVTFRDEKNTFRFGNGMTEQSCRVARLPLGIAETYGSIDAAVIAGSAPLLLGRPSPTRCRS